MRVARKSFHACACDHCGETIAVGDKYGIDFRAAPVLRDGHRCWVRRYCLPCKDRQLALPAGEETCT